MRKHIVAGLVAFVAAGVGFLPGQAHARDEGGALSASARDLIGRDQSTAVKGKLTCNHAAAGNVSVKLFDDDSGIDPDDQMAAGRTGADGKFLLSGYSKELTTIEPKLSVYHDCNDGIVPCLRKFSITIPAAYVTDGRVPSRTFDVGTIDLGPKRAGESRDCLAL